MKLVLLWLLRTNRTFSVSMVYYSLIRALMRVECTEYHVQHHTLHQGKSGEPGLSWQRPTTLVTVEWESGVPYLAMRQCTSIIRVQSLDNKLDFVCAHSTRRSRCETIPIGFESLHFRSKVMVQPS